MINGTVRLSGLRFHSNHGCLESERIRGNDFLVDVEFSYDMQDACESDNLEAAVDYSAVYDIVSREMSVPSNLLENVAYRIREAVRSEFSRISDIRVSVTKLNPPVAGRAESSSAIL